MAVVNEITPARLRELAASRDRTARVLSVYVDLDPREFAAPPARATEINSVLDEALRAIKAEERLSHDERQALLADVDHVRRELVADGHTQGARGLAVFASGGGRRLDILRLPTPVDHHVAIGDGPHLAPLARIGSRDRVWMLVVDRRHARLLQGGSEGATEIWATSVDEPGWTDRLPKDDRDESVDHDADRFFKAVGAELERRLREERRIDGLLLGGTSETLARVEHHLPAHVAGCLRGRFAVDVVNAGADAVVQAAAEELRAIRLRREQEAREALQAGLGQEGGHAVSGLRDTLEALHERRVERLLVRRGFSAAGTRCPQCDRLSVDIRPSCAADGVTTEPVHDVTAAALEAAWLQDAEVLVLEDGAVQDIAAITRF